MISRQTYSDKIDRLFKVFPVVAILGPRQCGKTTLAHMYAEAKPATFYDLESPVDQTRLTAPMVELGRLSGLVIVDEAQRMPALFEILRVLVDRPEKKAKFLLLGSASPHIVKGVSESLAGRIGFVDLSGFGLTEIGANHWRSLWLKGGFPLSYLANTLEDSWLWRDQFMRTFLERDIPQLGFSIPTDALRRFWTMVAHYHGQVWNAAEFARSMGTSEGTARRYLDLLSGAFMIRALPPWHENLKKRQVKAPKIYVRDPGLLHSLLGLQDEQSLMGNPKMGASWEGFMIEQLLAVLRVREAYFWATYAGAELDLLVMMRGRRIGFEIKFSDAPRMTKSLAIAQKDLKLDQAYIIYPGTTRYALSDTLCATPLDQPFMEELSEMAE